ncbi:MAG TPA: DUF1634 domain-containing protein [Bryobacteraceae bacterium]|nr:DUF1634 domain-containing protein [Bryobacteraceae bacterium]
MTPEERHLEGMVANLLRAGVILAAALVGFGGIFYLARHGQDAGAYRTFRGEPADFRTLSGVFRDAIALHGRGIIQLGLLLLIATPVARVAFSAYGFARLRDGKYVVITLIVLGLLLFSLFGTH